MGGTTQRRKVWLLVPDPGTGSILVDETGDLPCLAVEFEADGSTIGAVSRMLPDLGLVGVVIDCFIDQTPHPDDIPTPAVVELAPPSTNTTLRDGLRWRPLADVTVDVAPGIAGFVDDRFGEWREGRPVPSARSPWCRRGWFERAAAWIGAVLADMGAGPVVTITQMRHWGISAVMRVDTADGRYWFKSVIGLFGREPVITEFLSRVLPDFAPLVLAVEPDEGWMLMAHLPGASAVTQPERTDFAITTLVAVQHDFIGRTDELLAAGCANRPLDRLSADLDVALSLPFASAVLQVSDARRGQLLGALDRAAAAVGELGIPHTLAHGDFHPDNVMATGDSMVVFDWSDAAVAHPLIDVAAWASWFREEPDTVDRLWRVFAEQWSDHADPASVIRARPHLDIVTGAYHSVSYAHLVEVLEPRRRAENLGGLTAFFGQLDAALG